MYKSSKSKKHSKSQPIRGIKKKYDLKKVKQTLRDMNKEIYSPNPEGNKIYVFESKIKQKKHINKMLIARIRRIEQNLKRENVLRIKAMENRAINSKKKFLLKKKKFIKNKRQNQEKNIKPENLNKKYYENVEMVKCHCFKIPKYHPFHNNSKSENNSINSDITFLNKQKQRQKHIKNKQDKNIKNQIEKMTKNLIDEELEQQELLKMYKNAKLMEKRVKGVPKDINLMDIHSVDLLSKKYVKNPNRKILLDLNGSFDFGNRGNFGLNKSNSSFAFGVENFGKIGKEDLEVLSVLEGKKGKKGKRGNKKIGGKEGGILKKDDGKKNSEKIFDGDLINNKNGKDKKIDKNNNKKNGNNNKNGDDKNIRNNVNKKNRNKKNANKKNKNGVNKNRGISKNDKKSTMEHNRSYSFQKEKFNLESNLFEKNDKKLLKENKNLKNNYKWDSNDEIDNGNSISVLKINGKSSKKEKYKKNGLRNKNVEEKNVVNKKTTEKNKNDKKGKKIKNKSVNKKNKNKSVNKKVKKKDKNLENDIENDNDIENKKIKKTHKKKITKIEKTKSKKTDKKNTKKRGSKKENKKVIKKKNSKIEKLKNKKSLKTGDYELLVDKVDYELFVNEEDHEIQNQIKDLKSILGEEEEEAEDKLDLTIKKNSGMIITKSERITNSGNKEEKKIKSEIKTSSKNNKNSEQKQKNPKISKRSSKTTKTTNTTKTTKTKKTKKNSQTEITELEINIKKTTESENKSIDQNSQISKKQNKARKSILSTSENIKTTKKHEYLDFTKNGNEKESTKLILLNTKEAVIDLSKRTIMEQSGVENFEYWLVDTSNKGINDDVDLLFTQESSFDSLNFE